MFGALINYFLCMQTNAYSLLAKALKVTSLFVLCSLGTSQRDCIWSVEFTASYRPILPRRYIGYSRFWRYWVQHYNAKSRQYVGDPVRDTNQNCWMRGHLANESLAEIAIRGVPLYCCQRMCRYLSPMCRKLHVLLLEDASASNGMQLLFYWTRATNGQCVIAFERIGCCSITLKVLSSVSDVRLRLLFIGIRASNMNLGSNDGDSHSSGWTRQELHPRTIT